MKIENPMFEFHGNSKSYLVQVWRYLGLLHNSINSGIIFVCLKSQISSPICNTIPKASVFRISAKFATIILERRANPAAVIEFTKRRGRATRGSIFKMTKEWQRRIRSNRY